MCSHMVLARRKRDRKAALAAKYADMRASAAAPAGAAASP